MLRRRNRDRRAGLRFPRLLLRVLLMLAAAVFLFYLIVFITAWI